MNDELKTRGLLDGELARPRSLDDTVDVRSSAPDKSLYIRAVGHKAAFIDEIAPTVQHWHSMPCGEFYDPSAVQDSKTVSEYDDSIGPLIDRRLESCLELPSILCRDGNNHGAETSPGSLRRLQLGCRGWL